MSRVLVVNHAHSQVCGIHDLGKRIYQCLARSLELDVGYVECLDPVSYHNHSGSVPWDVVIVNYRADLMPWVAGYDFGCTTFAVLHQYEQATADVRAAELLTRFDHVLALDPQLQPSDPRVHAVGRPIPESVERNSLYAPVLPQIGSFGFAFPHKGFQSVANEIVDQCDDAVYNLHMPEAYFNGAHGELLYTDSILSGIRASFADSRLDLCYTAEHLAERELVHRLSMNDVNCLFYVPGQPDAGLSSAIDYLIAARRPILVSGAAMFRHAWNAPIWPDVQLGDILNNYDHFQQEADVLYNSMAGQLVRDVEKIVSEL